MAIQVLVGLKIGAAVTGSLGAAFSSAKSTIQQLGRATDSLTTKQKMMGSELAASLARGGTGVERLRRQYDQVGAAIDQLKARQERLNTSIARGAALKAERAELRGQALETLGTAAVGGAPIAQAMSIAIDFKDQLRDTAITGGFDAAQEQSLSDSMRGAAIRWNRTQTDVAQGIGVLIAGNISDLKELQAYAPVMSKSATATRASMDDLGAVGLALKNSLDVTAAGYERAMNILNYAGKSGEFELANMAKWMPKLAPQLKALGITGERAVAELGASLQIARIGAGNNDEAANNYSNFLNKLTSPETTAAFNRAGIALQESMKNMVHQGLSPAQAMIKIITAHLGTQAPAAAAAYRQALDLKDDQERQTALTRLDEAYKLSALFADQQVLAFVRPALANRETMASILQGSIEAADRGGLDTDWQMRMGSPVEQLKALTIGLSDLGIGVGSILLPTLIELTQTAVPLVRAFSLWAEENPGLVSGTVKLLTAVVALKLGIIGIRYGANLGATALNSFGTIMSLASGRLALFNRALLSARLAPFIVGVQGLAAAVPGLSGTLALLGGVIAATPVGWIITGIAAIATAGFMIYKYWKPIKAWVRGFFSGLMEGLAPVSAAISKAFAPVAPMLSRLGAMIKPIIWWFGELFTPVKLTGDALGKVTASGMTFGRIVGTVIASLLAPISWVVEGLGEIPAAFKGGLGSMAALIANFSPFGLFYRAFAAVMAYFEIELPGKFTEFGGLLITGLINGITSMAGKLKDHVIGIGASVKGWFTETLGIESPSRVFIGYGANISEGAALGIAAQAGLVRQAALGVAAQAQVNMLPPNPMAVSRASLLGNTGGPGLGAAAGQPIYHFSPQITLAGGANMRDPLGQALQAGYSEFVKFIERYEHDKRRRSYGPTDWGVS